MKRVKRRVLSWVLCMAVAVGMTGQAPSAAGVQAGEERTGTIGATDPAPPEEESGGDEEDAEEGCACAGPGHLEDCPLYGEPSCTEEGCTHIAYDNSGGVTLGGSGRPYALCALGEWMLRQDGQNIMPLAGADISWYTNNMTAAEFTITTPAQLYGLYNVNADYAENFAGKTIKLASPSGNFDMTGFSWKPVGNSTRFAGVFDGNGNAVSNLSVSGRNDYIGMFGTIAETAVIRNVRLVDCSIDGSRGWETAAVAALSAGGRVENCFVSGTVIGQSAAGIVSNADSGTVITGCTANVQITSEDDYAGGIVAQGLAGGIQVENCSVSGTVDGDSGANAVAGGIAGDIGGSAIAKCRSTAAVTSGGSAGGIAGIASGSVDNCYSGGSVSGAGAGAGGIAGSNPGVIQNCYSVASVEFNGSSSNTKGAGGISGSNEGGIENCYAFGVIGGTNAVAAGIAVDNYGKIENCLVLSRSIDGHRNSGRVSDYDTATSNNYGGLTVQVNGDTISPDDAGQDNMHGENIGSLDDVFGSGKPLADAFSGANGWQAYEPGHAPKLNVSGWTDQPDVEYGSASGADFEGAGTELSPYIIDSPELLKKLADKVNAGGYEHNAPGVYFRQAAAIDLTGALTSGSWVPIGSRSGGGDSFKARYDGGNHAVTGLQISGSAEYAGLFGHVEGVLENVGVVNATVETSASGGNAGGIAGYVDGGTVRRCYVKAYSVSGDYAGGIAGGVQGATASIVNSYAGGQVSGANAGGLAGFNNGGTIQDCYSDARVEATSYGGGLVGDNSNGTLRLCYAAGDVSSDNVAGGLAGYPGTLEKCAALNESVSNGGSGVDVRIGRIVGSSAGLVSLDDCYARADLLVNGARVLDNNPGAVKDGSHGEAVSSMGALFGAGGKTVLTNGWESYVTDAAPKLANMENQPDIIKTGGFGSNSMTGSGTPGDPYLIGSPDVLKQFAELVASGTGGGIDLTGHFKLSADISLSAFSPWTPIGTTGAPFEGTFDGDGRTISNMNVQSSGLAGLFGFVKGGAVKNLTLDGSCSVVGTGRGDTGGVAGWAEGSILENCRVACPVKNISGGYVGGIAGNINGSGTIRECAVTSTEIAGSVETGGVAGMCENSAIEDCYALADVNGNGSVGGIAGSLTAGSVLRCYATGAVSGDENVGGIAGDCDGSISSCAALNRSISGAARYTGRVVGRVYGSLGGGSNIAYDKMKSNAPVTGSPDRHGEPKTAAQVAQATTLFSGWSGWSLQDGSLPGLNGSPVPMPGHLMDFTTSLALTGGGGAVISGKAEYGEAVTATFRVSGGTLSGGVQFYLDNVQVAGGPVPLTADGTGYKASYTFPAGTLSITIKDSLHTVRAELSGAGQPEIYDSASLAVTKKELAITGLTAQDKVYDGTRAAAFNTAGASLSGILPGEDVSLGAVTGTFGSENAGSSVPVAVTRAALAGADAGNYSVALPALANARIAAKTLTVTGLTADSKAYDGSAAASFTGGALGGVVDRPDGMRDEVRIGSVSGVFAAAAVGTSIPVQISAIALTGAHSANYTAQIPAGLAADISPRELTVTGLSVVDKDYDGTAAAGFSGGQLSGAVPGDDVTLGSVSGTFSSPAAGAAKAVTITSAALGGTKSGQYEVVLPTGLSGQIRKRAVSVVPDGGQGKTFKDAEPPLAYQVSPATPLVTGESLNQPLSRAAGENAGSYAIRKSDAADAANPNYSITVTAGVEFTVAKASGLTAQPKTVYLSASQLGSSISVDLSEIALSQSDAGSRTYTLGALDNGGGLLSGAPTITGSGNTLAAQVAASVPRGSRAVQTLTVSTTNYEDSTAQVLLEFPNQIIPALSGTVAVQGSLTYGDRLGGLAFGKTIFTEGMGSSVQVAGTIAWDYPDAVPDAGPYQAAWTFTPEDTEKYAPVSGSASLTVGRAVPEVRFPAASPLKYGQTLAQSALTGGEVSGGGTFAWADLSDVPEPENSGYDVVLTPSDTANYDFTGVQLTRRTPVTVARLTLTVGASYVRRAYNGQPARLETVVRDENGAAVTNLPVRSVFFDKEGAPLQSAPRGAGGYTALAAVDQSAHYGAAESAVIPVIIDRADGTENPAYRRDLERLQLDMPHMVTNTQARLSDVALPEHWSWKQPQTQPLASDENGGRQTFQAAYASQDANYLPVSETGLTILVSSFSSDDLTMREADEGETREISLDYTVTGAPLTGNMRVRWVSVSASSGIFSLQYDAETGGTTLSGIRGGVGMAQVRSGGHTLASVLIRVRPGKDAVSANTAADLDNITEKLSGMLQGPQGDNEESVINALADEVTRLPDEEKKALDAQTLKTLDSLFGRANGVTLEVRGIDATRDEAALHFTADGALAASARRKPAVDVLLTIVRRTPETAPSARMELKLEYRVGGERVQPQGPIDIALALPEDVRETLSADAYTLNHYSDDGNLIEAVPYTIEGAEVRFRTLSFSVFAFERKGVSPPPSRPDGDTQPGTASSDKNQGGGDGADSSEAAPRIKDKKSALDFWDRVLAAIENAADGAVVEVNAQEEDGMPASVLEALAGRDVTLLVHWRGGDWSVHGRAVADPGTGTLLFKDLMEKYPLEAAGEAAVTPGTGGFTPPGSRPPIVVSPEDEAPGGAAGGQPAALPQPSGDTQSPADGQDALKAAAALDGANSAKRQFLTLAALCAAAAAGVWIYRKRRRNNG